MTVDEQQHRPLRILIVGAGIAGLSAAIALGKQGHAVVILEKSRFLRETGAAIHMPPNCTSLLEWLDCSPANFDGTLMEEILRYDSLGKLRYNEEFASVRHNWQAEWYLVHRVDLHNYLKYRAQQVATLHTGCKIITVDIKGEQPSVELDDGRVFACDLLLGADGLNSIIRQHVAPGHSTPYPVGKSAFRWLIPTESIKRQPTTKDAVDKPGVLVEWATSDRRLVAYPCSNNKMFNLCAFIPTAEAGTIAEGWQASGNKNALIGALSQFDPGVRSLAENAGDDLKVWELFDMKRLPSWISGHSALLGDAAHPFQPYMGQGGAMGIEDTVSLATLLPMGTRVDEIPSRLQLYEKARRPRVDYVLENTRLNGLDEDDTSEKRLTAAEMVQVMAVLFSHNEIENSTKWLHSIGE